MRSPSNTFIAEKNKRSNQPVYLYTIYDYDNLGLGHNLYLAEWDADMTFDGQLYTAFPITHEFIGENASGQIDVLRVTVANVSRVFQAYLEAYNIQGKKVDVTLVFADQLADTSAKITDTFYIDTIVAGQEAVSFDLSTKLDVIDYSVPGRTYSRNYCHWKFKGTECAYAGAETECNRTLDRCRTLANSTRFGGFPSIPQKRTIGV